MAGVGKKTSLPVTQSSPTPELSTDLSLQAKDLSWWQLCTVSHLPTPRCIPHLQSIRMLFSRVHNNWWNCQIITTPPSNSPFYVIPLPQKPHVAEERVGSWLKCPLSGLYEYLHISSFSEDTGQEWGVIGKGMGTSSSWAELVLARGKMQWTGCACWLTILCCWSRAPWWPHISSQRWHVQLLFELCQASVWRLSDYILSLQTWGSSLNGTLCLQGVPLPILLCVLSWANSGGWPGTLIYMGNPEQVPSFWLWIGYLWLLWLFVECTNGWKIFLSLSSPLHEFGFPRKINNLHLSALYKSAFSNK